VASGHLKFRKADTLEEAKDVERKGVAEAEGAGMAAEPKPAREESA
jgi:hypothetical protein